MDYIENVLQHDNKQTNKQANIIRNISEIGEIECSKLTTTTTTINENDAHSNKMKQ